MKQILLTLISASLGLVGCSGNKHNASISQGISGIVTEAVGNQMPSPERKAAGTQPVAVTVYVYELTNLTQVKVDGSQPFYSSIATKEIATVRSDKKGQFLVALNPGNYSLFTKVDGRFYANSFDGANNIQPVTVEAGKLTEANIVISARAFY